MEERQFAVPPRLVARLNESLDARADTRDADVASACLAAADRMLRDLLARGSNGRDVALDLLTVDALATYAFEAAAANPATLRAHAIQAASRFAAAAND
jgi:hypothetical protein